MQLVVDGITEPQIVDKTWMISTGAPIGPFAFLDIIGPNTPYNLYKGWGEQGDKVSDRAADRLKSEYLDKGSLLMVSSLEVLTTAIAVASLRVVNLWVISTIYLLSIDEFHL